MGYLQHKKYNISIFEHIISLLAPHRCICCSAEGLPLCCSCQSHLPKLDSVVVANTKKRIQQLPDAQNRPLDHLYAATAYIDDAQKLVASLKFHRNRAAAQVIAAVIATKLPSMPANTVITNIPTSQKRIRARGYDQAALIAKYLAAETNLSYAPLLERQSNIRQLGSSRLQRVAQAKNIFSPKSLQLISGSNILLIDDVLTTGATIAEASSILYSANAHSVSAAVFALAL